jgi:hypothetical protein
MSPKISGAVWRRMPSFFLSLFAECIKKAGAFPQLDLFHVYDLPAIDRLFANTWFLGWACLLTIRLLTLSNSFIHAMLECFYARIHYKCFITIVTNVYEFSLSSVMASLWQLSGGRSPLAPDRPITFRRIPRARHIHAKGWVEGLFLLFIACTGLGDPVCLYQDATDGRYPPLRAN